MKFIEFVPHILTVIVMVSLFMLFIELVR